MLNISHVRSRATDIRLLFTIENSIFGADEMIIRAHVIVYFALIRVKSSFIFSFLSFRTRISLEINQWSTVSTFGPLVPSVRDGHSACVIKNRMYIFGGFEDDVKSRRITKHRIEFFFRLNSFPMNSFRLIFNGHRGICIARNRPIRFL